MTAVAIELCELRKVYPGAGGEVIAVDRVSLAVIAGETLCLLGTSGCGKTTTLRMVNRLIEPTSGSVRIHGEDAARLDPIALRRGIGYVIQSGGLFPHMTALRNVGLLLELEGRPRRDVARRAEELLELVGLAAVGGRYPRELSGGQVQRVGLARALALDPPVLLMDEPFSALDPLTRGELRAELAALWRRLGKTVVVVTHDVGEAFALGDRVALMRAGRIVQHGSPSELRSRPADAFVAEFVGGHAT